ncbi:hypothetical protein N7E02_04450 (plasmid) [Aliirhizobium terrae]|uniref:hypothetical protein n=1 Tax=Terrirhizobium terrae TaxID=2926709 RepID=UPI0025775905|nr:hypothetical protein [Rhizobium sp. CC-CFT758]WJH38645.1 hypothetical protein N7E02_04450 [Rhizobium sp. CC-CFT758]
MAHLNSEWRHDEMRFGFSKLLRCQAHQWSTTALANDLPAILLDLNGTLIASELGILSSCRAALRELGHDIDPTMDIASSSARQSTAAS